MAETKDAKDAADVTEVPSGLDVVVTVPGTIVGSHDLQGTDGTERTDRPGEILGTPAKTSGENTAQDGRAREGARHDYVRSEVDRANREELPKLGGNAEDTWEPGDSKGSKARTAELAPAARTTAATATTDTAKSK